MTPAVVETKGKTACESRNFNDERTRRVDRGSIVERGNRLNFLTGVREEQNATERNGTAERGIIEVRITREQSALVLTLPVGVEPVSSLRESYGCPT